MGLEGVRVCSLALETQTAGCLWGVHVQWAAECLKVKLQTVVLAAARDLGGVWTPERRWCQHCVLGRGEVGRGRSQMLPWGEQAQLPALCAH